MDRNADLVGAITLVGIAIFPGMLVAAGSASSPKSIGAVVLRRVFCCDGDLRGFFDDL